MKQLFLGLFCACVLVLGCTTEQDLGDRPRGEGDTGSLAGLEPPPGAAGSGGVAGATGETPPPAPTTGCTGASACTSPPPATCADDGTVRRFGTGTCQSGSCTYAPSDQPCPADKPACFEGQCYAAPLCGGCATPPGSYCVSQNGRDQSVAYPSKGKCVDPATNDCSYTPLRADCEEDCVSGACVAGETCTLGGFCTRDDRGCKLKNGALRCLPADPMIGEAVVCDPLDRIANYRCASGLTCVKPSFATAPLCAFICGSDADCQNVGLLGHHFCVKIQNQAYGWCR